MDNNLPKLYRDYGEYSNYRNFPLDIDGLKPVERRVLLSAFKIAKNKFVKSIKKFSNSNFVARIVIASSIWLFALIPTWFYFLARWLIDPLGFWQELALLCIFGFLVGWFQIILIFFGLALTFIAVFEVL